MKMFPPKKRNITKLEKKERQEGLQVSRFGNLNEFKRVSGFVQSIDVINKTHVKVFQIR